jgi:sensor histidine kinase YesM
MQWHEFVFSQRLGKRLLRHFMFWITWWLYFSLCDYLYQQEASSHRVTVGSYLLLKTLILVSIYALASYSFIYFLFPQIIKGKWLKASTSILLLSVFLFITAWLMYWNIFPFIDSLFGNYKANSFITRFWPAVYLGLINPTKVVAAAGIIKYVKYWWLKKKESLQLEKEKINIELQLLKAQIHPGFLFNTLNNIYVYALAESPRASEMLLKLSDLLSYMLYECDRPLVSLEKEIEMMKEYIELEKIRMADNLEMEISVKGNTQNKFIAPFLLLPFIENSFKHSNTMTEKCWISLEIKVEENFCLVRLINGIPAEIIHQLDLYGNGLVNVQKRLNLLYSNRHELRINAEEEVFLVNLKIELNEGQDELTAVAKNETMASTDSILIDE